MQEKAGTHKLPYDLSDRPPNCKLLSIALILTWIFAFVGCATVEEHNSAAADSEELNVFSRNQNSEEIEPTVVAYRDYHDPLIGINRGIFAFNDVSYRYALIPLAKGYTKITPAPVRQSVGNFFYNIKSPLYLVNNAFQLKPKAAGTNILRFGINTTLGLLGLFDPAKSWFDIDKADTNLNRTLAHYGAGYGAYLVLPLIGSSDLRSGSSTLVEGYFHPINYLVDGRERILIQSFDYFQDFAPEADLYLELSEESDDPYIFFRNLYLQGIQRDAEYD